MTKLPKHMLGWIEMLKNRIKGKLQLLFGDEEGSAVNLLKIIIDVILAGIFVGAFAFYIVVAAVKYFKRKFREKGESSKRIIADSPAARPSYEEKQKQRETPSRQEEQMREALRRRNHLEERILKLIGGKTGMLMTWDEIIQCASAGDDRGFLLFAGSFPQKASILKEEFDELMNILGDSGYQQESSKNEIARQLTLPYRYESECRKLLDNNLRLTESNLLEKEGISSDELMTWCSQFTQ